MEIAEDAQWLFSEYTTILSRGLCIVVQIEEQDSDPLQPSYPEGGSDSVLAKRRKRSFKQELQTIWEV